MPIGTATDIYDNPTSLFVNRFVGHASCIRATVGAACPSHTALQISTGERLTLRRQLNVVAGSGIFLTARPEELTLSFEPSTDSLKAELLMSIPHGPNVIHSLALADGTEIRAIEPRDRAVATSSGANQVFVTLDANKLHAFPADEGEIETLNQTGALT